MEKKNKNLILFIFTQHRTESVNLPRELAARKLLRSQKSYFRLIFQQKLLTDWATCTEISLILPPTTSSCLGESFFGFRLLGTIEKV